MILIRVFSFDLGTKNVFYCERIDANTSRIERSQRTTSSGKFLIDNYFHLILNFLLSVSVCKWFNIRYNRSLHSIRWVFQRTLSYSSNDDRSRTFGNENDLFKFVNMFHLSLVETSSYHRNSIDTIDWSSCC